MNATARDLRFHAKEILEATMRGESVIVTYRGKPTAKIIPFPEKKNRPSTGRSNRLFGIWKDRKDLSPADYVSEIRKGRQF